MAGRTRIEKAKALASFSRPGNPYDNAKAEAGESTLKTKLLSHGDAFTSLEEARLEVATTSTPTSTSTTATPR